MRRVSSAGSLSEDGSAHSASKLPKTKHTSHPNLIAFADGRPPRAPAPLSALNRRSTPSRAACSALPLDALAQAGMHNLNNAGHIVYTDIQLESTLHVPAGQAEACLLDARRGHSVTLPRAPPLQWQEDSNVISADWVLSGGLTEELNAEETKSLAACLAAPPSEVAEEGREREQERAASQRASAANASRALSAEATRLTAPQETTNLSERFADLLRRVRRRRRSEHIAALRAMLPRPLLLKDEDQGKGVNNDDSGQTGSGQPVSSPCSNSPWPSASPNSMTLGNPLLLLSPHRMLSRLGL